MSEYRQTFDLPAKAVKRMAEQGIQKMRDMGASDAVIEAYLLLVNDDMPYDMASEMAAAAGRSGKDPVAAARHIIMLRGSLR